MKLSILIPLYNEEGEIINTLDELSRITLPDFISEREIIVIDDGSTDSSNALVTTYSKDKLNIHLVKHDKNKGKGAAIKTGIQHVSGKYIVLQDADMELNPKDIIAMLNAMNNLKVSFINGSRYLAGVNRPLFSYWRYMANQFFTALASIVVNVKFTDIACGYKLFTKDFIDKIQLKENRFGFETELMIKAVRLSKNRDIAEVPVHYTPRNVSEGKKIRNTDGFRILGVIIKYGVFRMN